MSSQKHIPQTLIQLPPRDSLKEIDYARKTFCERFRHSKMYAINYFPFNKFLLHLYKF